MLPATCTDAARRRWYHSYVVVGRCSGVEAAGEINDLVLGRTRYGRTCCAADVSVTLVDARVSAATGNGVIPADPRAELEQVHR